MQHPKTLTDPAHPNHAAYNAITGTYAPLGYQSYTLRIFVACAPIQHVLGQFNNTPTFASVHKSGLFAYRHYHDLEKDCLTINLYHLATGHKVAWSVDMDTSEKQTQGEKLMQEVITRLVDFSIDWTQTDVAYYRTSPGLLRLIQTLQHDYKGRVVFSKCV